MAEECENVVRARAMRAARERDTHDLIRLGRKLLGENESSSSTSSRSCRQRGAEREATLRRQPEQTLGAAGRRGRPGRHPPWDFLADAERTLDLACLLTSPVRIEPLDGIIYIVATVTQEAAKDQQPGSWHKK
jgi:hypothetical protein